MTRCERTGNSVAEQPSPDDLDRCTVCALMIPLRDNGEIETHYRNIGQCRGTGQPPDLRTDLERAEGWWRGYVAPGSTETHLGVLLAEFDRRGAELDRIRRVRCLGHVYSGLQPPEQCGDYAGHEGKCQP